ncbi:hypothetical protein C8F04DRAFT_1233309 [Mycena alexandri]|uniref:Uncharacterized protein n=1 Tax=Mycena alexandri TaxID=1745969 RepID=A0AAD6SYU8_9AGAR|nr:hypothetical protein C8F04DRAFT_1233309 [Mycena alexandri]
MSRGGTAASLLPPPSLQVSTHTPNRQNHGARSLPRFLSHSRRRPAIAPIVDAEGGILASVVILILVPGDGLILGSPEDSTTPSKETLRTLEDMGRDKTVPELSETVAYNPFEVDMY